MFCPVLARAYSLGYLKLAGCSLIFAGATIKICWSELFGPFANSFHFDIDINETQETFFNNSIFILIAIFRQI